MAEKLEITLVKSIIGRPENQRKVLSGLGLTKVNKTVIVTDTPSTRGMANKVIHLIKVVEK